MKKDIRKLFVVLGFYSFGCGLFYNFQQLWMAENNLSLKTISTVYSLCAIITVSMIFLCSNLVQEKKLKSFTTLLLFIKTISMFALVLLHNTGLNIPIKFIIMMEYAIDVEIFACFYPLMSIIKKDNRTYAKRGLTYSFLYYVAAILAGIFLGKTFFGIKINYNLFSLIGTISVLISFLVILTIDMNKYVEKLKSNNNYDTLFKLIDIVKKDRISHRYLGFVFNSSISYYTLTALLLTLLTTSYRINESLSSMLILGAGILSSVIGMLVLSLLTFKNDYVNISIKYFTRTLLYVVSFIIGNKILFLVALLFTIVSGDSYSHISDAPYVNRFSNKYQFAFCNLKEMVGYAGRAIGTFFCGLMMAHNIKYLFLIASIFSILQLMNAYSAIYLRKKEEK